uniref:Uncharacterized protein n=1 Tax=Brevundimonas basaltis TaxID=472166 RepID=A0A7W8MGJ3_9CAUL|nr:hypothetical protein [Brevundimonas basaltis]
MRQYPSHDAVEIVPDGSVAIAERRKPFPRKGGVPPPILLDTPIVSGSVDLDDQPPVEADEVEIKAEHRMLATEVIAPRSQAPQCYP